jgi:malonyl-CoA/methylmalonyl-CoA synthetase
MTYDNKGFSEKHRSLENSMNLVQILSEKAQIFGSKTAVQFNQQERSFADLDRQVEKAAEILKDLNIRKGDRVALILPKGLEFIELYLATLGIGAIALPLNPTYRPEELLYFLADSESSLAIIDSQKYAELEAILNQIPILQVLIIDQEVPQTHYYPRLLRETPKVLGLSYPTRGEDVAMLCYTSGTTGRSKGAMITHENLIENMKALNQAWRWTERDKLLHVLPLFHIHGLAVAVHGGLYAGSTMIMRDRFDPLEAWHILEQERCTMLMAVPTIYHRLSQAWETLERKPNLETVRVFISGSAPLPEPLFHRFKEQTDHTLLERYGMTETGMITSNPYDSELRKVKSVGYPLNGVAIRLMGKEGRDVTPGEIGEVWIKGHNVFKGYWNQPEKTEESFQDGWFKSGDLGYQDPEDHLRLYLVSRAKELIITGGYNVYPKEVENILEDHAAVQEAAVFGLADEDFGEQVTAAVVLREGRFLEASVLIKFCKTRLAGYKCPQKIFFRPSLPRNPMGKIQKHLLQKEYEGSG